MFYCKKCGAEIHDGERFCYKCGATVVESERMSVPSCPKCGAAVSDDEAFCYRCGAELNKKTEAYKCPACGKGLKQGVLFCNGCGYALTSEAARIAEEREAKRKAEEAARIAAEQEAKRKAEEAARIAAEQEAKRKAEEEAARLAAEQEAKRKAEEAARLAAEQEAKRKAEEAAHLAAEQEAKRKAEEAARLAAEQEARRKTEKAARIAAEQEARRKTEEAARIAAESASEPSVVVTESKQATPPKNKQGRNANSRWKMLAIISCCIALASIAFLIYKVVDREATSKREATITQEPIVKPTLTSTPKPDAEELFGLAEKALKDGQMEAAKEYIARMGALPYNTLPEQYEACVAYINAYDLMQTGNYAQAYFEFLKSEGYHDSAGLAKECCKKVLRQYEIEVPYVEAGRSQSREKIMQQIESGTLKAYNNGDGELIFLLEYSSPEDMNFFIRNETDRNLREDFENVISKNAPGTSNVELAYPIDKLPSNTKKLSLWFVYTNDPRHNELYYQMQCSTSTSIKGSVGRFTTIAELRDMDVDSIMRENAEIERSGGTSLPEPITVLPTPEETPAVKPIPAQPATASPTPRETSAAKPAQASETETGSANKVALPNVIGMKESEARAVMEDAGFVVMGFGGEEDLSVGYLEMCRVMLHGSRKTVHAGDMLEKGTKVIINRNTTPIGSS